MATTDRCDGITAPACSVHSSASFPHHAGQSSASGVETRPGDGIGQIIETNLFIIEGDDLVRRSIEQFRLGKANFADYLIGNIARNAGCTDTVTFDRALAASPEFTVLHRSSA